MPIADPSRDGARLEFLRQVPVISSTLNVLGYPLDAAPQGRSSAQQQGRGRMRNKLEKAFLADIYLQ